MSPTIRIPIESRRQIAMLCIVAFDSALSLTLVSLRYIGRWRRQGKLDHGDLWVGIAEVGFCAVEKCISWRAR